MSYQREYDLENEYFDDEYDSDEDRWDDYEYDEYPDADDDNHYDYWDEF